MADSCYIPSAAHDIRHHRLLFAVVGDGMIPTAIAVPIVAVELVVAYREGGVEEIQLT